jgi:hypothetical protein
MQRLTYDNINFEQASIVELKKIQQSVQANINYYLALAKAQTARDAISTQQEAVDVGSECVAESESQKNDDELAKLYALTERLKHQISATANRELVESLNMNEQKHPLQMIEAGLALAQKLQNDTSDRAVNYLISAKNIVENNSNHNRLVFYNQIDTPSKIGKNSTKFMGVALAFVGAAVMAAAITSAVFTGGLAAIMLVPAAALLAMSYTFLKISRYTEQEAALDKFYSVSKPSFFSFKPAKIAANSMPLEVGVAVRL